MYDLRREIGRLAVSAVGLLVAAAAIPGIHLGGFASLLAAAIILTLVNYFIKPLANCCACLLHALTLGLFTLVVNALMLWLTGWLANGIGLGFRVDNFLSAFLGALILSSLSFAFDWAARRIR